MIFVFAGPTISHAEIEQHLGCICLPPIRQGDILRLLPEQPVAIGIVDGYFEGVPSVWHKEILYALDQGVQVFGSASMGALRAAELSAFGMIGIGRVYEDYRDGLLEDDDEVAVVHGPEEVGFITASEPMVNIRATLDAAVSQNVLNDAQRTLLLSRAKGTFYKNRSWSNLLEASLDLFDEEPVTSRLGAWLQKGCIDIKQQDAVQMLKTMSCLDLNVASRPAVNFHFEWTNVWDVAFNHVHDERECQIDSDSDDCKVLDQLRLLPEQFDRYRDKSLLNWVCNHSAFASIDDFSVTSALKIFRVQNQLTSRRQLLEFMRQVDLDESRLTTLLERASRVESMRNSAGDLLQQILDELRLDGRYIELLELAKLKQRSIESAGLDRDNLQVLPPQILAWYFERQSGGAIPRPLENHLKRICIDNSDDFYRLISKEYLYWRYQERKASIDEP